MAVTGDPAGPPMKVGIALLDLIAGLECAVGGLAALVGRGRVGRVEVSLVEAGVSSLINVLGSHLATGVEPGRHGNAHPNIAPYQAFAARDGDIVIAVGNDAQFGRLLGVLGLDDVDGRFGTNPQRVAGRAELAGWLGGAVASWERAPLVDALASADVPAGPVNTVGEALGAMGESWTQAVDGVEMPPSPIRMDGRTPVARLAPPLLGEHTEAILANLG